MRRIFVFFLWVTIWLVSACNSTDKVPRGILTVKDMKAILLDMQLADAYNEQQQFLPDTFTVAQRTSMKQLELKTYYAQILRLHHVTREKFLDSYHYYENHPDLMQDVYDMMTAEVKQTKAALDSAALKKRALQDSLRLKRTDSLRLKADSLHPGPKAHFAKKNSFLIPEDTAKARKDTTAMQEWNAFLLRKNTKTYRLDTLWKSMQGR